MPPWTHKGRKQGPSSRVYYGLGFQHPPFQDEGQNREQSMLPSSRKWTSLDPHGTGPHGIPPWHFPTMALPPLITPMVSPHGIPSHGIPPVALLPMVLSPTALSPSMALPPMSFPPIAFRSSRKDARPPASGKEVTPPSCASEF